MPSTRSAKRSAEEATGSDDDPALLLLADNSDEADQALALAKSDRSRKAKQRRLAKAEIKAKFGVLMVGTLMPTIIDMFDSPKDLFHLAFAAKSAQAFITRDAVVRASVYNGGTSREIIRDIMSKIEERSIYLPSAIRLLRLVNGKKCENHRQCWSYDLRREKHTNLATANYSFRPHGLLLCKECTKGMSTTLNHNNFATSNDRVGDEKYGANRTLDHPWFDTLGERHGPIILTRHLRQVERSYHGAANRRAALNDILADADKAIGEDQNVIIDTLIEEYNDAEKNAEAFLKLKRATYLKKIEDARKERISKKLSSMKSIYQQFQTLLDGYAHKDIALMCEWDEEDACISFELGFSREILEGLFSAPSGVSKKTIAAATVAIRRLYDDAGEKGLLSPDDLISFLSSQSSDLLERTLFYYFEENPINRVKLLSAIFSRNLEGLDLSSRENVITFLLDTVVDGLEVSASFALAIVPNDGTEDLRSLAQCAYSYYYNYYETSFTTRQAIEEATDRYTVLRGAISTYLERPETVSFMSDTSPHPTHPILTRSAVAMTIFKDKLAHNLLTYHGSYYYGDDTTPHRRVLARHIQMFQSPSSYPVVASLLA